MSEDESLKALRYLKGQSERIKTLRLALQSSEAEIAQLKRDLEIANRPLKRPKLKSRRKKSKPRGERSFILGLTDNHYTQIVDPDLNGGINEHNEKIGLQRVLSVVEQANEIIEDRATKYGLSDSLIWLGGDSLVNSDLHPHFARMTPYEPLEELDVVLEIKRRVFSEILAGPLHTPRVHSSISNHGRHGKKEEVSAEISFRRSFDVKLAQDLERIFPELQFNIEKTFWGDETVGNCKSLLHHGQMISMTDNRHTGMTMPNWTQIGKKLAHPRHHGAKLVVIGHWHTPAEYQNTQLTFVSAGCTVGADAYSYGNSFYHSKPSQPLVEIDSTNGEVVAVHRINCSSTSQKK
jgi:hypothetical protein